MNVPRSMLMRTAFLFSIGGILPYAVGYGSPETALTMVVAIWGFTTSVLAQCWVDSLYTEAPR